MRAWDLQTALRALLLAHTPLMALATTVYDHTPQDAEFPYVVIGEGSGGRDDTDDSVGADHMVTIHTWSRYRGLKETKQIQQELYNALHRQAFTVDGALQIDCNLEAEETFLDEDGLTRHGVQRFRVLLDEVDS